MRAHLGARALEISTQTLKLYDFAQNRHFLGCEKFRARAPRCARTRIFWKYGISPFKRRVARMRRTFSYFFERFDATNIFRHFLSFLSYPFSEGWHFWKPGQIFQYFQFSNRLKKITRRLTHTCDTAFERWDSILSENSSARAPWRARALEISHKKWKLNISRDPANSC